MNRQAVIVAVALIAGCLITHFSDAAFYHHHMDVTTRDYVIKEANMGTDFATILGETKGKIYCPEIRDASNRNTCEYINSLRN